jgi:hypothetical protein
MRVTGHRHSTAGDVWILDEAQSLALIEMGEKIDGTDVGTLRRASR